MRVAPLPRSACLLAVIAAAVSGCVSTSPPSRAVISIDGSSTVYPLAEAIAEDFQRQAAGSRVTIGVAGTGGGLRRFCRGGLDLATASRPISPEEAEACARAGVEFLELPLAYDGIVVAVHPDNTWVESLSIDDLRRLWRHEAEGKVVRWSDLRAGFPRRQLHLFGAGPDSGTFDYFTGVISGAPRDSRGDYTASENDHILVQGVAGDPDALGYFGYAYFDEQREYLRAVPIRSAPEAPAVSPTVETIRSGEYRPLSRPVFAYVNLARLARPDVEALVTYALEHGGELAADVGYVPLDPLVQQAVRDRVEARVTGSLFVDHRRGVPTMTTLAERLGVH